VTGFARREGELVCDGVPLRQAAERFGTPLYVYSASEITRSYRAYAQAFAAVPHRICYALKANANGALLRLLAGLGAGADIVSGGELLAALRAGFAPDRIIFSGVGKTQAEIEMGLIAGVGEFNAESEREIERIGALAAARGRVARVTLRVNPDIDPGSHPYVATGLRENKFGVAIGAALEILERARRTPGVSIVGVQSHIGSQITELGPLREAARALARLSRRLAAGGFPIDTLDIGGGLGVDYDGSGVPSPADLARAVIPEFAGLGLRLVLEPGRSLLAAAGVLLTRVLELKAAGDRLFVVVDAGMNDLLRPALYGAHHRIEPVSEGSRPARRVDVVGPVCESGDFLARDRELPTPGDGELLAVRDVGAYGFVMASNYNLRPRPAEALADSGCLRLIRRRETFEDLVRTEL